MVGSRTGSVAPLIGCLMLCALFAGAAQARDRFLSAIPAAEGGWEIDVVAGAEPRLMVDGQAIDARVESVGDGRYRVILEALPAGVSRLGLAGEAVITLAPVPEEAAPFNDWIVYHIMAAYFDNGAKSNDKAGIRRWTHRNYAGGDLAGVLNRADYIAGLGVNAVWLSPVFHSETSHGYDVLNYYRIGDAMAVPGDAEASLGLFTRLVAELDRKGVKVILDLPLDYGAGAYDRRAGDPNRRRPRSTKAKQEAEKVWESWGTGFRYWNFSDDDTRRFLLDVPLYWLEQGVGGFRLDYVRGVDHEFWAELYREVKAAYPGAFLFGEAWIDADGPERNMADIATYYEAVPGIGYQFDALIEYPMQMIMTDVFATGASVSLLEEWLQATAAAYGDHGAPIYFLDNHDLARFSDFAVDETRARVLAAITFMASLPGPMSVYYGTETALAGSTPKRGFNDTNRIPMPWDGLDESLIDRVSAVFRVKRANPVLTHGARLPLLADESGLLMARTRGDDVALVAVNLDSRPRSFDIPAALSHGRSFTPLAGDSAPEAGAGGGQVWLVPELTTGIVLSNPDGSGQNP